MTKPPPPIISREAAHAAGKRFYFTGEPCKHGHLAQRYTSTNGCVDCLRKFKPRVNAYSKDKVPFAVEALWVSKRYTPEQLAQLRAYLQTAADTFEAHALPPVCVACNGTRYVPKGAGSFGAWELCTACAVDEPSTANQP